jgi:hypothetical protein
MAHGVRAPRPSAGTTGTTDGRHPVDEVLGPVPMVVYGLST